MINDTQNLKSEIISTLDSLPMDSLKLLAKFAAFLRTNIAQDEVNKLDIPQKVIRISSPRLVHQNQATDLKKEVIWETADDSL